MKDARIQAVIDAFYKQHGPCCAGCDWWRWQNSIAGECIKTVPVAGVARFSMLGATGSSLPLEAGHIMTPRDHVCGEFRDAAPSTAQKEGWRDGMKTFNFRINLAVPVLIGLAAWAYWWAPHDDTDAPGQRSGLVPYTDNKTGCQYLKAGSLFGGALTPRMGTDGKQICNTASPAEAGQQPA